VKTAATGPDCQASKITAAAEEGVVLMVAYLFEGGQLRQEVLQS